MQILETRNKCFTGKSDYCDEKQKNFIVYYIPIK